MAVDGFGPELVAVRPQPELFAAIKLPTDSRGLIDPVAAAEQHSKGAHEHYGHLAQGSRPFDVTVTWAPVETPNETQRTVIKTMALSQERAITIAERSIRLENGFHNIVIKGVEI
jgi:hypothetical protein